MILLTLFAIVAGAATALSPCVLPLLPAILASGTTGGRRRPLGVATGLVASFTFTTVALIYVLDALGLPDDFARNAAIVVLAGFGIVLLVPSLRDRLEAAIGRVSGRLPRRAAGEGFGSGLVLGFSLGFVYAPCAGPILAAVATASVSQPFSADKLVVAFAYAAGSGVVIYGLMLGGRRLAERLRPLAGRVNPVMGCLMIAFAIALVADADLEFQQALAEDAPTLLSNPTRALEDSTVVRDDLDRVSGRDGGGREEAGAAEAEAGLTLPRLGQAPEFAAAAQRWFNSEPLTMAGLRGKVVLIDFWTYTCINCIRTMPELRGWWDRYRDDGLVIVGVHTPEFPFEREAGNVEQAIDAFELDYPVIQDNEYGTWNAWGNRYWPAKYLIDAEGQVRYVHFGEGGYETTELAIRSLLAEAGATGLGAMSEAEAERGSTEVTTPELYLGAARAERVVNGPLRPGVSRYDFAGAPPPDHFALRGQWAVSAPAARAVREASILLDFGARDVYLVLGGEGEVGVRLDGAPIPPELAGADVAAGAAEVRGQRLYHLVDAPAVGRHLLELEFAPGVSGYAFTFG